MTPSRPRPGFFALREERVALVLLLSIGALCFLGPALVDLAGGDPSGELRVELGARAPSLEHPLGTDRLGRDMLAQLLLAARASLSVALLGSLLSALVGGGAGLLLGHLGRPREATKSGILVGLLCVPWLLLLMLPNAIAPVFDRPLLGLHRGTVALSGMLGLLFSLPVAAEVRQGTLRVRGAGWVEAATAMGLSRARVFLGHVLPEVLGVVRRNLFRIFPGILVAEALMAFLAVGARKPPASLGALIRSGSSVMAVYPWLLYVPALFLVGVCVCSFVLARGEPEFEAEETP